MHEFLIKLMADGAIVPIVLIGGWALLFNVKYDRIGAYSRILLAGLTSYTAAKLIASIYQPESVRPFQLMGEKAGALFLNNPGFPSDHVLFCTAITLAVWFETRNQRLAILLGALTIIVAVGRVVALVHTPLDVIGGLIIGMFGIVWYLQREPAQLPGSVKQWSKPKKAGKIS